MIFTHHSDDPAGLAEMIVVNYRDFYATPLLGAFDEAPA
jgi:hypothetical protein